MEVFFLLSLFDFLYQKLWWCMYFDSKFYVIIFTNVLIVRTIPFAWNLLTAGYVEQTIYGVCATCFVIQLVQYCYIFMHLLWMIKLILIFFFFLVSLCLNSRWLLVYLHFFSLESYLNQSGVLRNLWNSSLSSTCSLIFVSSLQQLLCTLQPGWKLTCKYCEFFIVSYLVSNHCANCVILYHVWVLISILKHNIALVICMFHVDILKWIVQQQHFIT